MRRPRMSGRRWLTGLLLLPLLAAVGVVRAEGDLSVKIEGDGKAFAGFLERGAVRVLFESRVTEWGAESRILSADGEVLTEVIVDGKAGTFDYRAGGVSLSAELSAEEASTATRVFDREDAALAADLLWATLTARGFPKGSPAMAVLAANLTGYVAVPEKFLPDAGKASCTGCCGPSCWGCTGCYTAACLEHDLCVAAYGYLSPRCMRILYVAALSAWCCQGVDLGQLC